MEPSSCTHRIPRLRRSERTRSTAIRERSLPWVVLHSKRGPPQHFLRLWSRNASHEDLTTTRSAWMSVFLRMHSRPQIILLHAVACPLAAAFILVSVHV